MSEHVISVKDGRAVFFCPGCKDTHGVWLPGSHARNPWTWNGSLDKPTFTPSVLTTSGHFLEGHTGSCWCTWNKEHAEPAPFTCRRCHSFVTDGQIQFLGDCSHDLANQTVPLPQPEEVKKFREG